MKKQWLPFSVLCALAATGVGTLAGGGNSGPGGDESKVQQGFEISPVPLDLRGKNRALVGLGSYIVNAQGGCNDCHTCPSYADTPFDDGEGAINSANYLAGGVPFGPFSSANLTPDAEGNPGGLTLEEFVSAIRTGEDPHAPGVILQVMPWFVFRNMTDRDLHAVYEFLRSIPPAEPGDCDFPGQ